MLKVFITKLNIKYETFHSFIHLINKLEGTARYAGLPIAPAEGFGLMQSCFLPLQQIKMKFWANLGNFWDSVVI